MSKLRNLTLCILLFISTSAKGSDIKICLLETICEKLISDFDSFRCDNRLFVLKIFSYDSTSTDIQFSLKCIYNDFEYKHLKSVGYFNVKGDTIVVVDDDFKIKFNEINPLLDLSFRNKLQKTTGSLWDGYILNEGSTYVVEYSKGNLNKKFYGTSTIVPDQFRIR
jgi:hypothetical protein